MNYVTESDIRDYIKDRSWEDNDLALDLSFSSEEIETAMKSAAREFNSTKPILCHMQVSPCSLPGDTNIFYDGVAAALLRTAIFNLSRNDLDYSAGNMTASADSTQIKHYRQLAREYQERFITAASDVKRSYNLIGAYGTVG